MLFLGKNTQLLMQDLLGSFCPFDMVANKPQKTVVVPSTGSLWDHNEQSTMSTYDEPTASKGKKKKNLCILKLASLWGYLLLQHNLTILTDT